MRPDSRRGILLELGIITAGVLIALMLDGVTGWFRDRALVRAARANITREIRDNAREIDITLQDIPRSIEQVQASINLIDAFSPTQTRRLELKSGFPVAQLSSASWTTASATRALALMKYAEVNKYARAFDLQQKFEKLQDELLSSLPATIANLQDPTAPGADLRGMRRALAENISGLRVQEDIAKALAQEYRRALQ